VDIDRPTAGPWEDLIARLVDALDTTSTTSHRNDSIHRTDPPTPGGAPQ
jgi:hypothetical protein